MKDYKAAALALPTIVALTLGGVALTAAPALAEPAPATTAGASAAPVDEGVPAGEPAVGDADGAATDGAAGAAPTETPAEVPAEAEAPAGADAVPTAPDTTEPTEPAESEPASPTAPAPALDADPAAEAAPEEPEAALFSLVSPVQGQVVTESGLTASGTVGFAGTIDVTTPEGELLASALVVPGDWSLDFGFPEGPAGPHRVVVTATDAAGPTVRAVETRDVVLDVPTSPAPTITAPVGPQVTARPSSWVDAPEGWGDVTFRGTGVAGSEIDIDLDRTDGGDAFGHGHDPIVVQADGTWEYVDLLQADAGWRVSVRQYVPGVRYLASLPSARVSRDFRLVAAAVAPVVPVAPVLPVETVVVPAAGSPTTAAAARTATRSALAQTGADHAGDAALAGLGLLVLGAAATVVARRRRA
ncbi:LPXTG cell wall anchor domain-containing protein [Frigoribacterium faeni]|uniref:LPXTG cell wall anchor domain-containing protein n=1 Tax=Frigoribacterium faeni TaxID=145483 RepID=UPI00141AE3AC|nr:LPXTG cell wall anchor domain-containing protein [Frigoribacterium faeni]NIJ06149.1 LPXTG-motif cell wall-anchored protein [Frigoribacterium faeni]